MKKEVYRGKRHCLCVCSKHLRGPRLWVALSRMCVWDWLFLPQWLIYAPTLFSTIENDWPRANVGGLLEGPYMQDETSPPTRLNRSDPRKHPHHWCTKESFFSCTSSLLWACRPRLQGKIRWPVCRLGQHVKIPLEAHIQRRYERKTKSASWRRLRAYRSCYPDRMLYLSRSGEDGHLLIPNRENAIMETRTTKMW